MYILMADIHVCVATSIDSMDYMKDSHTPGSMYSLPFLGYLSGRTQLPQHTLITVLCCGEKLVTLLHKWDTPQIKANHLGHCAINKPSCDGVTKQHFWPWSQAWCTGAWSNFDKVRQLLGFQQILLFTEDLVAKLTAFLLRLIAKTRRSTQTYNVISDNIHRINCKLGQDILHLLTQTLENLPDTVMLGIHLHMYDSWCTGGSKLLTHG